MACLYPSILELQMCATGPVFYKCVGNLNPGPQACTASIVSAKPSLQPPYLVFLGLGNS